MTNYVRIPVAPLTPSEVLFAGNMTQDKPMSWPCRDARTAALFARILAGDIKASPGYYTLGSGRVVTAPAAGTVRKARRQRSVAERRAGRARQAERRTAVVARMVPA